MPVISVYVSQPSGSQNTGRTPIDRRARRDWLAVWLLMLGACLAVGVRASRAMASEPVRTQVTLRNGESFAAKLTAVIDQAECVFDEDSRPRSVKFDDLVLWGAYAERSQGTQILLSDGSVVVADVLGIEQDALVVIGRLWQETRLPRTAVRAIIFHPPSDSSQRDKLFLRALATDRQGSHLLLENGDELTGQLPDVVPREAGAFQLTRITWTGEGSAQSVDVPLDRILAVLLATNAGVTPLKSADAVIVGLNDGSLIRAQTMRHGERSLEFQLAAGLSISTEASATAADDPWGAVVMLQPLRAQVTYVSDLNVLGYKHIPFLDTTWSHQLDRSVSGGRLRHAGHVWTKGLGMHSSSRLAVETRGQYQQLQAELAIDQRAAQQGSVIFRVYVQDATGTWSLAYESGVVRGGDPLVPMRVDIRSAVCLALLVDFADRGDQWDHANWLNARLIPAGER
ncbi:MAG: NPCBM/NEW2 domain-containing protein [Pirellulaceae bacterium]